MSHFTNRLLYVAGAMMTLTLLSGCVINKVGIYYIPQMNVTPIAGADRVPLKVEVVDARLIRIRVGQLGTNNDYNNGAVYATNDPVAVLKQAVEMELANRGFQFSDHGPTVVVYLEELYGVFDVTRPKHITASARISVRIRKADRSVIYQTVVTGKGEGGAAKSEAEASAPFAEALQNCLGKLFADPKFINALLNASG